MWPGGWGLGAGGGRETHTHNKNTVLSGKLEIQVEILNRWRYATITDGFWMTHRDTRHQIDGKSLCDF